jgi:hypothetical protein
MQGQLGVWSKQVLQNDTVGRPILQTAVSNVVEAASTLLLCYRKDE